MKHRSNPLLEALLVFAALSFATIALLALSSGLAGSRLAILLDPIDWLAR